MIRLATISLVALVSLSPPQNPADEVAALKREVAALKEQQARMQQDLQAIKSFLQAAMGGRQQGQPQPAQQGPELPGVVGSLVPTEGEPSMGSPTAKVTIMEVSDYHCPFCRRQTQQTFPLINDEFIKTGKARYLFVDYPIAQLHPQAARAHEAAACAGEQGKFWQMHASLFASAPAKDDAALTSQAQAAGANVATFKSCLSSGRHTAPVQASVSRMEQLGIGGTPMTLFGITPAPGQPMKIVTFVYGARPYADFKAAIESVLK
ncbi:MAG TPA: thioredoxin domain-containing protein [Vicinamibacterales bacterium]|nr:thioredoxin domain-containing protein [Vicinamibacterales bacterium]